MLPPTAGLRSIPLALFDIRLFLITRFSGPFGSMSRTVLVDSSNTQFSKIRVPLPVNRMALESPKFVKVTLRSFAVSFEPPQNSPVRYAPAGQSIFRVWSSGKMSVMVLGIERLTEPRQIIWPLLLLLVSATLMAALRLWHGCVAVHVLPLPVAET